jgi:cell division protease FtsH
MVKEWGMSDKIGRSALSGHSGGGPFMGMQMLQRRTVWGNKVLGTVEEEVERLVNNSYIIAKKVLTENRDLLEHVTKTLMEQETVSAEEFQMMLVEFNAKTIDYAVLGEERNREKLPFQGLPSSV